MDVRRKEDDDRVWFSLLSAGDQYRIGSKVFMKVYGGSGNGAGSNYVDLETGCLGFTRDCLVHAVHGYFQETA